VFTHLFDFNGTNGRVPYALVMDNSGNLYGTAIATGTIFKLAPDGTFTNLYRFTGDTSLGMLMMGRDGHLYGRTYHNNTGAGIVYRFTLNNGTFTTLAQVTGCTVPLTTFLTQGTDGYLYGTTAAGGTSGAGTVFRVNTNGGGATTLVQFDRSNGAAPSGSLAVDRDGNLYGTTSLGPGGFPGSVFKVTPAGVLTTLAYFTGPSTGVNPYAGVVLGMDGNLYGTTWRTVFRVPLPDGDTDGDGVPNDRDECADTPAGAIVNEHGCSLEQLVPCSDWDNHGHYLSAFAAQLAEFLSQDLLTPEQADALFTTAAQSHCGKKQQKSNR
jgi:uncharacterized repeat protein (TIGR03803 family)